MEANSAKKETMNVAIPAESADDPLSQIPSIRSMRDVKFGLAESQVSFMIPTNEDAACHVHKKHGQHSWQAKILSVIHAKWFQRQMLGLLLLDILILFTELFLMATVSYVRSVYESTPLHRISLHSLISACSIPIAQSLSVTAFPVALVRGRQRLDGLQRIHIIVTFASLHLKRRITRQDVTATNGMESIHSRTFCLESLSQF